MSLAVTARALGKTYRVGGRKLGRTFRALDDVSFEIEQGETVGVIGRNGAGKSTLLRILAQITEPTDGIAQVRGRVASLLEVGTGFHPELTGRENVFLNGATHGMRRAEIRAKLDDIIEFAGVDEFIDAPIRQYSTGMYMRLAFAVAAHVDPEVLLVDEVLAVGDAEFQRRCLGRMEHAGREGRTVLFVSHNMTAVKCLCARALLLEQGRLVEDGPSVDVVRAYLEESRVSAAEALWADPARAPGNEHYRLHAVRVARDGRPCSRIAASEAFEVEVEYWNLVEGSRMGVTAVVQTADGVPVFTTLTNRDAEWHERRRPLGLYRSSCLVPADLLAAGRFTITVILWGEGYSTSYTESDAVEFEVDEDFEARGDYLGGWVGVVRPRLEWRTEAVR